MTIVMFALLGVMIFMMFRNGKKRKAEAAALQAKMVPGADVMTNFGLFGTVRAIDEAANKAELEIAPGVVVSIHRGAISRVVEDEAADAADESDNDAAELNGEPVDTDAPEFGERAEKPKTDN
ncbi:MAG TPA: preprotein translocase subunit YajC [Candidatus Lumbricidophila sp.]|nr:preprotein translocase subunit YajC [Candidatus Lumbricidophila sp.]